MYKKLNVINVSPYDETFPIMLLSDAFNLQLDKAENVAKRICDEVGKQSLDFYSQGHLECDKIRIVVDASEETLKDIHEGRIKLVEENGNLYAQLKKNGRYSSKLPVKEELYNDGWNSEQVATAMQLKSIQESLLIVSKQLKIIDERVQEVVSGQQNDRMGIYYSGVALYIESTCVADTEMRKSLVTQALRALTETIFQMTFVIQSDIKYLSNREFDKQKKIRTEIIKEKMDRINQSFSIIHQASILKAGIYCQEEELLAASAVLEEYSRFINGTIANNAELLSQCDIMDRGSEIGVWRSRTQLELDVSKLTEKLKTSDKIIYIDTRNGGIIDESI